MKKLLFLGLSVLLFSSCLGISADIQVRRNGSVRLSLEYRYSRMAETIGRLDGTERWNIIPTGKADWERTVQRLEGCRLVSFSARETSSDIINSVTLDFADTAALAGFWQAAGSREQLTDSREQIAGNRERGLRLILSGGVSSQVNADLMELLKQSSAGYSFKLSFSGAGNSTLSFTDGAGVPIDPPAAVRCVFSGRRVSFEIDTADLLELRDGLGVVFSW